MRNRIQEGKMPNGLHYIGPENLCLILNRKNSVPVFLRSAEIRFSFDDQGLCGSTDIYALKQKDSKFSLKYLLTILNSKLLLFYYILEGKKKGDILEVGTESLSKIPIPNIDSIKQIKFTEKAEKMIQLNNDLNDEINGFKEWLQRDPYNIVKFSQKLDKYYELSFDDFLN